MISSHIQKTIIDRFSDKGRYFRGSYDEKALAAIEETRNRFPLYENITYTFYQPRPIQRYLLIADPFKKFFNGKILDVGSRDTTLEKVTGKSCSLVDKNNPNLPEFDWEKEKLPFPDKSFDTIVCLDTLEHIEHLHEAIHDLFRVSSRYVIISLPNCWRKTLKEFLKGRGTSASYGLPPEKPFDRHRWFFETEDIENFLFYNAARVNFRAVAIRYHVPQTIFRHRIIYPLARWLLLERYFKSFLAHTVFVCFERV